MMVQDLMGKLKWTGKLKDAEIIIRHRGAPQNRKSLAGEKITEVKKSYFLYTNDKETFIPFHRVMEVRVNGKQVWKRV